MAYVLSFKGRETYGLGKKLYQINGVFYFDEHLHLVVNIDSFEDLYSNVLEKSIEGHTIKYSTNGSILSIDNVKVSYTEEGEMFQIGESQIRKDKDGRIIKIGEYLLEYNAFGRLVAIGRDRIIYNLDGSIQSIGGKDYNFLK